MPGLQGARSGGMAHHIQGPHLIPNVGREAMLAAEVVRTEVSEVSHVLQKWRELRVKSSKDSMKAICFLDFIGGCNGI